LGIRVNNLYAENYIQKGEYDYAKLFIAKAFSISHRSRNKESLYSSLLNQLELSAALNQPEIYFENLNSLREIIESSDNAQSKIVFGLYEAAYFLMTNQVEKGNRVTDSILTKETYLLPNHVYRKAAVMQVSSYYDLGQYEQAFDFNGKYRTSLENSNKQITAKSFEMEAFEIGQDFKNRPNSGTGYIENPKELTSLIINALIAISLLVIGILIYRNTQISRKDTERLEKKIESLFDLNQELRRINDSLNDSKTKLENRLESLRNVLFAGRKELSSQLKRNDVIVQNLSKITLDSKQSSTLDELNRSTKSIRSVVEDIVENTSNLDSSPRYCFYFRSSGKR